MSKAKRRGNSLLVEEFRLTPKIFVQLRHHDETDEWRVTLRLTYTIPSVARGSEAEARKLYEELRSIMAALVLNGRGVNSKTMRPDVVRLMSDSWVVRNSNSRGL